MLRVFINHQQSKEDVFLFLLSYIIFCFKRIANKKTEKYLPST